MALGLSAVTPWQELPQAAVERDRPRQSRARRSLALGVVVVLPIVAALLALLGLAEAGLVPPVVDQPEAPDLPTEATELQTPAAAVAAQACWVTLDREAQASLSCQFQKHEAPPFLAVSHKPPLHQAGIASTPLPRLVSLTP